MDVKDLKFVRLTRAENARLIPKYLIDQVKDKDFTTDAFFRIAHELVVNPHNIIGVFVTGENVTKGFMWAVINVLTEQLYLVTISIDKEYQNQQGDTIKFIVDELKKLLKNPVIKLLLKNMELKDTILLSTNYPKIYEKCGWSKSKRAIMEISRDSNENNHQD